jgi:hypothetical protein
MVGRGRRGRSEAGGRGGGRWWRWCQCACCRVCCPRVEVDSGCRGRSRRTNVKTDNRRIQGCGARRVRAPFSVHTTTPIPLLHHLRSSIPHSLTSLLGIELSMDAQYSPSAYSDCYVIRTDPSPRTALNLPPDPSSLYPRRHQHRQPRHRHRVRRSARPPHRPQPSYPCAFRRPPCPSCVPHDPSTGVPPTIRPPSIGVGVEVDEDEEDGGGGDSVEEGDLQSAMSVQHPARIPAWPSHRP